MLTKIDHWIRENLILKTHIYTMRMPEEVPAGVQVQELPESPTRRYRFRFICNSPKKTDQLVEFLRAKGMLFTTQVVEESSWYQPLIAPKGKSIVFVLFWLISMVLGAFGLFRLVISLKNNPEFMKNFQEAVDLFLEKS
ncbi:MAG: hypothetical protein Q7Q71_13170 [Verrucomicrobiota bacterium JB023]|nr:hypothetical protein [Verrucomicrobiota bacterium JB023]